MTTMDLPTGHSEQQKEKDTFPMVSFSPDYTTLGPILSEADIKLPRPTELPEETHQKIKMLCDEFGISDHIDNMCWFSVILKNPIFHEKLINIHIKEASLLNSMHQLGELLNQYEFDFKESLNYSITKPGEELPLVITYKAIDFKFEDRVLIDRIFKQLRLLVGPSNRDGSKSGNISASFHSNKVPTNIIRDSVAAKMFLYLNYNNLFLNKDGKSNKSRKYHFIGQLIQALGYKYEIIPSGDDPISEKKKLKDAVGRSIQKELKTSYSVKFD